MTDLPTWFSSSYEVYYTSALIQTCTLEPPYLLCIYALLLGLAWPSQILSPEKLAPGDPFRLSKMLGFRAPLRRPSWDRLGRVRSLPERSWPRRSSSTLKKFWDSTLLFDVPREPSSTLIKCWVPALLFDAPFGPDSAVSNSSREKPPEALFVAQKLLGLRAPLRRLFSA